MEDTPVDQAIDLTRPITSSVAYSWRMAKLVKMLMGKGLIRDGKLLQVEKITRNPLSFWYPRRSGGVASLPTADRPTTPP